MKRYKMRVKFVAYDEVVVDAIDEMGATATAAFIMLERFMNGYRPSILDDDERKLTANDFPTIPEVMCLGEDPKGRSATFICEHCERASPKEYWGPGRITCPLCKKQALSVAQTRLYRQPEGHMVP